MYQLFEDKIRYHESDPPEYYDDSGNQISGNVNNSKTNKSKNNNEQTSDPNKNRSSNNPLMNYYQKET